MTKNEYTVFQKTKNGKKVWCVYFRDENGKRLNPIYVSKLKKMVYKGRDRNKPIPEDPKVGKQECLKICEKSLHNEITRDYIFNDDGNSPNFIEMVRKIWDYNKSPYIRGRLKENKPIQKSTCDGYINPFNDLVVPLIPKDLTLKDIEKSNGGVLTIIRDRLRDEVESSNSTKNKGLQSMRTTLEYCCQRSMIKDDYKKRLSNFHIGEEKGNDDLDDDEINKINTYLYTHTQRGTWERYKYLVCLLGSTTGLRPSEIIGLKRQDIIKIDNRNKCGVILVNHGINRDNEYSTRKNKDCVYVSTYIPLIEEIIEFSELNPMKTDWCFWDRNHMENHLTRDQVGDVLKPCLSDVGIKTEGRKISFYSLRVSAATIIGNKKSYKHHKSSSVLGQKGTKVTEEHYIKNTIDSSIDNFKDIRQYIKLPSEILKSKPNKTSFSFGVSS